MLCPELRLHLITDACRLWTATDKDLDALALPAPYWAFAWAGGQALARYVLDHRIPIECCLQSNVHTGAVRRIEEHPFRFFLDLEFRVTLNTDNRLMSRTTMTDEFRVAHDVFGCGLRELERVTVNAMKSAFFPYAERCRVIRERIQPGYAALLDEVAQ